jgi:UDP-glucose 4-epimerase
LLLGGGFISTALIRRLVEHGRCVHVVTRKAPVESIPGIVSHIGDVSDATLLQKLERDCGTVIYLASTTTPGTSANCPVMELDNLRPMLHLLEVVKSWQDMHLIFLSSGGTVYGNPLHNPVAENAPLSPLSYHGAAKVALEGFLNAFRAKGRAVTILRPSNSYGPEQSLRQAFGLIRTVLQHVLDGTTMEIWGDGENVRDFVYVKDVADAIIAAVNAPMDSGTYNVGSGKGHTVNRVLTIAERICGAPVQVKHREARSADVREVVLDVSRIRERLGWQPRISLEEGILQTWEWLKKS